MAEDPRTRFAMAAVDFANLFNEMFKSFDLSGYGVRLTAPQGPSTGGGVQSLQHVTLMPKDPTRSLVVATCDKVSKEAEIRTFEQVAELFSRRFSSEQLTITRQAYEDLASHLRQFFKSQDFRVETAHITRAASPTAERRAPSRVIWWVVLVLVIAAGAAAAYFLTR